MTPSAQNNFQTPVEIAFDIEPQTNVTRGNLVENSQIGNLAGDLWLSKDGKVVVNDSDWLLFDKGSFTCGADNVLTVTGLDMNNFNIGDLIRVNDDGTDRYGYIIDIDTSNKKLYIGLNVDIASGSSVDGFAIGISSTPSGHPIMISRGGFDYWVESDLVNPFDDDATVSYYMNGPVITVFVLVLIPSSPGIGSGEGYIKVDTPLTNRVNSMPSFVSVSHVNTYLTVGTTTSGNNHIQLSIDNDGYVIADAFGDYTAGGVGVEGLISRSS